MGVQRKSREVLLQLLFQAELNTEADPELLLEHAKAQKPEVEKRATELFLKILDKKDEIDKFIEDVSSNWKIHRMDRVDRNILRLATYELKYCKDIPGEVVLDEAIEIAKRFGTAKSGKFVNGILDKVFNRVQLS